MMLIRVAGQNKRQRAVTGDVAGGAEAVLQGKDGQHKRGAGAVKQQDAGDQTERSHNRTARHAGCADGKNAEQHAEQDHGSDRRNLAVQNLRDCHDEENLGQHRAAQMDVGEQRNTEINHVLAQHRGFLCAAQSNCQSRRGGHRADRSDIRRTVVLHYFDRVLARVRARNSIEQRHPDIMTDHNDDDDLDEHRKLLGDRALIRQTAEGGRDKERQNRDDDLGDDGEDNVLHLVKQGLHHFGFGPGDGQTDHQRQRQCAHHVHDRRDLQLEHYLGQLAQAVNLRYDRQVRNECVTGCRAHQRRADRRHICDNERNAQHSGCVVAQLGDGRRNKADNDQRHTERDDLTEHLLDCHDHVHHGLVRHQTEHDAHRNAKQQLERQAV